MSEKYIRCVDCRSEFTKEEIATANACPCCGTKGLPALIANDLTVQINLHELRILTIWASNWARGIKDDGSGAQKTIRAICTALKKQLPEGTCLTMEDEMAALQEAFPQSEMLDSEGKVIVPKKSIQ